MNLPKDVYKRQVLSPMKIACISLGCPKNQVDLDVMVHILLSAGHETVADLAEADVILVNTCGFTLNSDRIPVGNRGKLQSMFNNK